jgi:SAM-dependent methyltransferase
MLTVQEAGAPEAAPAARAAVSSPPRRAARYWSEIGRPGHRSRPSALWREHCDAVNASWLERHLPAGASGAGFERVLLTDLFDEAVGTGSYPRLARGNRLPFGVDLAAGRVAEARARHPSLRGVVADVRALPCGDATLDVVVSLSTLDHFASSDELVASLRELQRVLRPGGKLLLTLDNLRHPVVALRSVLPFALLHALGLVPYYVGVTCGPRRLRRLLTATGFEVESLETLLHGPRVPAVALARILDGRAPRAGVRFLRALAACERLGRLPTRFLSGHFLAAVSTRA